MSNLKAHSHISMENLYKEIAERKRTEVAVAKERQQFYDVLEMLPVYVVLLTPDYHVPFANRFFRERFGESHGRRCYEYLFKRTEPCEICKTFTVLNTGKPHHWEWLGPDGHNYDIHDFPFTDTDGSPLIMEVGIDITEAKRAEAALKKVNETLEQRVAERTAELRKSEEKYRNILENMNDSYFETDLRGNMTFCNPMVPKSLGYSPEEMAGMNHRMYMDLENAEIVERNFRDVYRENIPSKVISYEVTRKGGTKTRIETSLSLIKNKDGRPIGYSGMSRDITERKQAETVLAEQLAELLRWREATLGREGRILEIKGEVNELLARAGKPPRYPSAESQDKKEK
jgi:PAS domain S-box-containing protein